MQQVAKRPWKSPLIAFEVGIKELGHPCASSKLKRSIDILGALVGLLITALILVPVAMAIAIDDPGPIFFTQMRVGYRGKRFRIWKLRTMVKDAEQLKHRVENQAKGFIFKNDRDPRITRVGHFLRRTSLDEFPQFWNVLVGDMSLVGTRPPTVDEVEQYLPHHWQRLEVKPGITGQWQVSGRSEIKDFEAIVALDLQYQRRWSPSYDLWLICKTVMVLFNRRGAC